MVIFTSIETFMHNIYKKLKFNVASLPCAIPRRRTAKAAGPHAVRHLVTLTGMWTRLCRAPGPRGARQRHCWAPGHQGWQVGPPMPCARPPWRTTKALLGTRAPRLAGGPACAVRQAPVVHDKGTVGHQGTKAGRWARLCRAPGPHGARQRHCWAPGTKAGRWARLCRAPGPHGARQRHCWAPGHQG
jgi:hypothetical protein